MSAMEPPGAAGASAAAQAAEAASRQWVVTAYVLAFGRLLPLGGRLGDALGRKTMFIAGLLGFAIASAAGGAARNIGTRPASPSPSTRSPAV